MSITSQIWYLLLDDSSNGSRFKGTFGDALTLPTGCSVLVFRNAVHVANSIIFTSINHSQLLVYKNIEAYNKRIVANDPDGAPLRLSQSLDGLGISEDSPVIVVVPSASNLKRITLQQSLTGREPNVTRRKRWEQLNEILATTRPKKSKTNDSSTYSDVSWNQVSSVFRPTKYQQRGQTIDNARLTALADYLSVTTKVFGDIFTGKEAKRLYFIAPILITVCSVLKGDVSLVVEEDLKGTLVKAHSHFEFMIKHDGMAVCIVEAKKDDIEKGIAQDLVGCEVASEVGDLDTVYGIVTNYTQWVFLRSLNDKVEREECLLDILSDGPEPESLKKIAEKIHGMLCGLGNQAESRHVLEVPGEGPGDGCLKCIESGDGSQLG